MFFMSQRQKIVLWFLLALAMALLVWQFMPYRPGGRIQIGDFAESFISPTIFWSEARYMAQWQGALHHLLAGKQRARLITSVLPAGSAFAMCWTLYRVKQQIYIQNNLVLCTQQKFDSTRPHQFIRPRQTRTAEGHHISEWQTSLDELQAFLDTLPPPNFDQL